MAVPDLPTAELLGAETLGFAEMNAVKCWRPAVAAAKYLPAVSSTCSVQYLFALLDCPVHHLTALLDCPVHHSGQWAVYKDNSICLHYSHATNRRS